MSQLKKLVAENRKIRAELIEGCGDTRARVLAAALRSISLESELIAKQALPQQMAELGAQLQADREERARMESGVQFADEGAELPPLGGDACN